MHVRIGDGLWHRQAVQNGFASVGVTMTACGLRVHVAPAMGWQLSEYSVRRATYGPPLCNLCFTTYELRLAAMEPDDD